MMEFFEANKDILLFTGAAAVKMAAFLGAVMGFTALMTLAERKVSALMQDRIGPNRASVFGFAFNGLFQPIADAIKMILKEDFVPGRAEKFLFTLAPFFALVPVLALFAVIPFGDYVMVYGYQLELQVADLPLGLFFVLALSGLAIYGVFLGGWASKNNFALLGAMRGAAQMVSYEVVLGLTLVGLMMIYGSASLQDMVRAQGGLLFGFVPAWGVVYQPFAFILFLVASTAENKRTPFDLVEGESEIIGYFMEYSSMRFAAFMFAEFLEIVLISMLLATLFFGGWQVPYLYETGFIFPGGRELPLNHYLVSAMQVGSFAVKTIFFSWFSLVVRWTLPRFRFDQMMGLCWKALLPLALLNILITGAVMLALGKV
ncbi:MAG: NADH-quinone oxidoreductase subunit NuoH [Elusimicrobiota bacterium]|nr:NADH-quinone oxidoreductase subunit NuoH [Elusimicrobiota bacterium]